MRVTAEAKAATRQRILAAARRQFAERGYETTTTRDIAQDAGIAVGTLFNYFPTKEDIVLCLASAASQEGQSTYDARRDAADSLNEELFAYVAAILRKLKPLRDFIAPLLETHLSPLSNHQDADVATLRRDHLEVVQGIIAKHGPMDAVSPVALQLYWTLYTGVLAYWAHDTSRKQEATLALLDESLAMFVAWLEDSARRSTTSSSPKRG